MDFPASHITRGCLISCFSSPCMVGALHGLRPHLYPNMFFRFLSYQHQNLWFWLVRQRNISKMGRGNLGPLWVFWISEAKDSIHWNTTNHGWSLIHTHRYIYNIVFKTITVSGYSMLKEKPIPQLFVDVKPLSSEDSMVQFLMTAIPCPFSRSWREWGCRCWVAF